MLKWRVHFFYRVALKQEDFWKDEAKFWNKDVESFLHRDKGVAEAVAQTVGAIQSPLQKVLKLYAFVSQLENRSYIPERTEQEEHTLQLEENKGAEDVLRQRSGYHDDLNRLFVAMVRAAGLPASLMRVASREDVFFDPAFISTEQFDGEVAVVQLDGKDVFLDPGTKYCPYGLLNWRYTNSKGLRQGAKGAEFAETPLPSYNQARTERVARVKLLDDGTVDGTVILAFFGLEAMNRRQEGARTDEEGRKKMLENELRSWLPGGADVTLTKPPAWDKTEQPLAAEFKITSPLAVSGGKRWLLSSHIFQVNQKAVFSSAQRNNPVYFIYPTREIDEVHITLPANAEIESLPANDTVKLDYALYRSEHKREEANTVFAVRDLVMGGLAFPVDEYKDLKGFYDKVKAHDDEQVLIKGSQNVAGN